ASTAVATGHCHGVVHIIDRRGGWRSAGPDDHARERCGDAIGIVVGEYVVVIFERKCITGPERSIDLQGTNGGIAADPEIRTGRGSNIACQVQCACVVSPNNATRAAESPSNGAGAMKDTAAAPNTIVTPMIEDPSVISMTLDVSDSRSVPLLPAMLREPL